MAWVLYIVSLVWVALGSCAILYTTAVRNMSDQWLLGMDRRVVAVFLVIIGVLMIISMTASQNRWLIALLGGLALLKGGFIFLNPKDVYGKFTGWFIKSASDQTYRFFGIMAIILGTVVLSWIS